MTYPTPVLYILGPLLAALVTTLFSRWQRSQAVAGLVTTAVLLWVVTAVAPQSSWFVGDEWVISGQTLIFNPEIKIGFQYLLVGVSLLFLLALWLPQGQTFVPAALATLSPLAAALMITPFTFGAVFLIIAAALAMGTYQPQRLQPTYGGLRYLLLVALTAPLLLLAGWLFDSGQAAQQTTLITQILFVVCLILLAGFPLYIWVQPIVTEAPLLVLAFLFGLVQLAIISFIYNILQTNAALIDATAFKQWISFSGVATLLLAALLALTARRWRDLVAYLLLFNMGLVLLTLAMPTLESARATAVAWHGARFVSLLLVMGGFTLLKQRGLPDEIDASGGYGRRHWRPMLLFIYGGLSLLCLPLTISFAPLWTMVRETRFSTWYAVLFWIAFAGIIYAVLRTLNIVCQEAPDPSFATSDSGS